MKENHQTEEMALCLDLIQTVKTSMQPFMTQIGNQNIRRIFDGSKELL